MEKYININEVAKIKGLNSNRSIRLAIQKGKYIAREVEVRGGKSYEILYSSLEAEVQEKLEDEEIRGTSLVPILNQEPTFISEKAKMTALARVDILHALLNIRGKYSTKKEADSVFLDLYNSGMLLPKVYNFIGSISKTTLYQWLHLYKENSSYKSLLPGYKVRKQGEYNSILNNEMKEVFFKYLMHPNKFSIGKAINLTKHILEKRGYENIPCDLTFNNKVIIVDEVDYLIDKSIIETLRDLHDKTGCPVVLVGMGAVDKKLARYPHLMDRIYKKLKFEKFNSDDIKEILTELTDLKFKDDAIEYLATRTNQFRQLVKLINRIEKLMKTNQIEELDEYTMKGLLKGYKAKILEFTKNFFVTLTFLRVFNLENRVFYLLIGKLTED